MSGQADEDPQAIPALTGLSRQALKTGIALMVFFSFIYAGVGWLIWG
jgi:hypothetical protein